MVRFILVSLFLSSFSARADFLGFKTDDSDKSRIQTLVEKLKGLEMDKNPAFEENFNQLVKSIETTMEDEKLYCSGEAADPQGKVLSKDQKQLCFRNLKGHYLEAVEVIFTMKKKYLGLIHSRQIDRLTETQKKVRSDIEKSF